MIRALTDLPLLIELMREELAVSHEPTPEAVGLFELRLGELEQALEVIPTSRVMRL